MLIEGQGCSPITREDYIKLRRSSLVLENSQESSPEVMDCSGMLVGGCGCLIVSIDHCSASYSLFLSVATSKSSVVVVVDGEELGLDLAWGKESSPNSQTVNLCIMGRLGLSFL